MSNADSSPSTRYLRIAILVVVALVALWVTVDAEAQDLHTIFVCAVALVGMSVTGGFLDRPSVVGIELAVVLLLGVATFSGDEHLVWAGSIAVTVVALGKVALLRFGPEGGKAEKPEAQVEKPGKPEAEKATAEA